METQRCIPSVRAEGGYPPVKAEGRNPRYAEAMLSNVGGVNSELTAVSHYFYSHLAASGVPEVSELLRDLYYVELHHLEIFGTLARQLGADPRFWAAQRGRRVWWSPDYVHYTQKLSTLLHSALRSERMTLRKYENQARWIRDANVLANLQRIIQDEQQHIEILTRLWESYATGTPGRRR